MSVSSTPNVVRWVILCLAGAALGGLGVFADQLNPDFFSTTTLEGAVYFLITKVGNAGPVWILAAVIAAYVFPRAQYSTPRSMVIGAVFLVSAVLSYYTINIALGSRDFSTSLLLAVAGWAGAAVVAGMAAGVLAVWIRSGQPRKQWLAVLAIMLLAALDVVSLTYRFSPPVAEMATLAGVVYAIVVLLVTRIGTGRWSPILTAAPIAAVVAFLAFQLPVFEEVMEWSGILRW